jgi:AraC-like DNA-binding protein/mannose-6-phosphate isomerase-like protein (cupin superfamily)
MKLEYNVKPILVNRIYNVTHKGKRRDSQTALHVHDPDAHELIYVDYGNVHLRVDEMNIDVAPGHCIIIQGGSRHWFSGKEGAPFDYLNIMFHGKIPSSLFSKSIHIHRDNYELMERLKKESVHELPYCREVIASCLTLLLANLIRQTDVALPNKLPEFANSRRYQSQAVSRAMTVIANKYASPLDMKQLSRSVGISESYLSSLIKRETGESFTTILQKQRVAAAKHLLRESVHSFQEISSAVGYGSVSFFFKIFKRITGMTPKAYSNSLGEPTEWGAPPTPIKLRKNELI